MYSGQFITWKINIKAHFEFNFGSINDSINHRAIDTGKHGVYLKTKQSFIQTDIFTEHECELQQCKIGC